MSAAPDHFIYIIAITKSAAPIGPVKIGITKHVGARLRGLQTACPYPLALVHTFTAPNKDIARDIERAFHEVQKEHKTSGEWFNLEPLAAVLLMCMNIEITLHYHTNLDQKETAIALEMCGVASAYEKLIAATAQGTLQ